MGTFGVGIKVEIKIIQYVYIYVISHLHACVVVLPHPSGEMAHALGPQ